MGQSRRHSLLEVVLSVLAGYFLAILTQVIVYPWFGMTVNLRQNAEIALIFTVVSIVRGYFFRRVFNHLTHKESA